MAVALRKNIARSISEVDLPEIYLLNRILNPPRVQLKDIGSINSFLDYTDHIILEIKKCSVSEAIIFKKGIGKGKTSFQYFLTPQISPVFFEFYSNGVCEDHFEKIAVNYKEFNELIEEFKHSSIQSYNNQLFGLPKQYSFKGVNIKVDTFDIRLLTTKFDIANYPSNPEQSFVKEIPEALLKSGSTIDLLKTFEPKITEVELLDGKQFELSTDVKINETDNVIIPATDIKSLKLVEIESPYLLTTDLQLELPDTESISTQTIDFLDVERPALLPADIDPEIFSYESASKNLIENPIENIDQKFLYKYLEPVFELTENQQDEILSIIPDYQKTAAKFLYNSELALLTDEFELGRETETVMALRMKMLTRAFKKILIITEPYKEMALDPHGHDMLTGIWNRNIKTLVPEFDIQSNLKPEKINTLNELSSNIINLVTYEIFEKLFKNPDDYNELNIFDCIIVDSPEEKYLQKYFETGNFQKLNSNSIWILTGNNSPILENICGKEYKDRTLNCFGRKINEIETGLNLRQSYAYAVSVDKENREQSNNSFYDGRRNLQKLLDDGNILRFKPNVNQLIQNAQQKINFSEQIDSGNKIQLLKFHLKDIFNTANRVLIFSQYEGEGIQKIKTALEELNYEFVIFDLKDSFEKIEEKINYCENSDGNIIYLTNLKPNAVKFRFPKVSHIINYDFWWNPAGRWQLENKITLQVNTPVSVYNYFYKGTMESKIYYELEKYGLLDRNIVGTLTADKFYDLFDERTWINIYNLNTDIFPEKDVQLPEFTNVTELVNHTKCLLENLNFMNLKTHSDIRDHTFVIKGLNNTDNEIMEVTAVCVFKNNLNSYFINDLLTEFAPKHFSNKLFIITNGTISRLKTVLPDNVSLIDGNKLQKYSGLFSC